MILIDGERGFYTARRVKGLGLIDWLNRLIELNELIKLSSYHKGIKSHKVV